MSFEQQPEAKSQDGDNYEHDYEAVVSSATIETLKAMGISNGMENFFQETLDEFEKHLALQGITGEEVPVIQNRPQCFLNFAYQVLKNRKGEHSSVLPFSWSKCTTRSESAANGSSYTFIDDQGRNRLRINVPFDFRTLCSLLLFCANHPKNGDGDGDDDDEENCLQQHWKEVLTMANNKSEIFSGELDFDIEHLVTNFYLITKPDEDFNAFMATTKGYPSLQNFFLHMRRVGLIDVRYMSLCMLFFCHMEEQVLLQDLWTPVVEHIAQCLCKSVKDLFDSDENRQREKDKAELDGAKDSNEYWKIARKQAKDALKNNWPSYANFYSSSDSEQSDSDGDCTMQQ